MLKAVDISEVYNSHGVETIALQHANFQVERGEYVALLGPGGSGKSTLLKIAGLLAMPTSGTLWFLDKNVAQLPETQRLALRRGNIAYLQSDPMLIDNLSVYENIELPLVYLNYSKAQRQKLVKEQLAFVKMLHVAEMYPYQLTAFQKQMVSMARSLVTSPLMILADEPTVRLNSMDTEEFLNLLDAINSRGIALVFATALQFQALRAERTINLFDGHVVRDFHAEKNKDNERR